jgi:AmmeMemoRadiSam system protein A
MKRYDLKYDLDHGVIVPLYFVNHFYNNYRLLPISTSGLSAKDHYRLGMVLRKCVEDTEGNVVVIASGNLSHRLKDNGPYRYTSEGAVFDEKVASLFKTGDGYGLLDFAPKLKEKATQCCFNSFLTIAGTADGSTFSTEIFSYERPFGIGYMSAEMKVGKAKESVFKTYRSNASKRNEIRISKESLPQRLARTALNEYLISGKKIEVPRWFDKSLCERKGGVFVSVEKDGQLRGCIGSTIATQPNIAEEIIAQAIDAGTKDTRFTPIQKEETDELAFSVDLLSAAEEVNDKSLLDPKKYGIIVENHGRSGVLLPDIEGIGSVEEQLRIAREKAGIHPWRKIKIKRFSVLHYE